MLKVGLRVVSVTAVILTDLSAGWEGLVLKGSKIRTLRVSFKVLFSLPPLLGTFRCIGVEAN